MKRSILFIIIGFFIYGCSSCTTTKFEQDVLDNLSSTFAGYGECGSYDDVIKDLKVLVKKSGCLDEAYTASRYVSKIPDGVWSAKGICCFSVLQELGFSSENILKTGDSWRCVKQTDYDIALKECQKLE